MIINEKKNTSGVFDKILELLTPQDKDNTEIMPYKKIVDDGILKTKDNTYQAFLKVKTTDLTSLNDEEFNRIVIKFTYLNRVYQDPYKIVSLTYPTDVIRNGIYWKGRIVYYQKRLYQNDDSNQEKYLNYTLKLAYDNYSRIENFVSTLPERAFTIIVYGKTQKEIMNSIANMKQSGGKELDLKLHSKKETSNIVKKLLNMNTNL